MLSARQNSFLHFSDAFFNCADGAVRSGKTHAALRKLGEMAIRGPAGDLAVVGKTERTVKRNVVYPLQEMYPKKAVRYIQGAGEVHLFGKRCWIVGANDARAEEKVRGMTLAGAYCNELTLYPRELFYQLIDRCSVPGAKILADTNPDSPYHWLHTEFFEAELPKQDFKRWRFTLHDNPILEQEYIDRLNRMHAPGTMWHKRMVMGEWVVAEGAVFDNWDENIHVVKDLPPYFEMFRVGIDVGTANPTAFLLLGKSGQAWYVVKEYYHDGRATNRQKTDAEYAWELRKFLVGISPASIEVDPSALSFSTQLKRDGVRGVRSADNAVLDGIRTVSTALSDGTLFVHESCENLRREMSLYAWDSRAQERGEDRPLKINDHCVDALRYASMRIWNRKGTLRLKVNR